jgi:aspartyl/asparaginyl beta-hydroxylase (cupin superfamily)
MVDRLFSQLLLNKLNSIKRPTGFEIPHWVGSFIENFDEIKKEFEDYRLKCNSGDIIDEISNEQKELNRDKKWRAILLYGYFFFNHKQLSYFPKTLKIIKKHQSKINLVMFSTTESGKHIQSHKGNNHGVLRIQIGIDISDPENCVLRVENTFIKIKEKELFIFDDTFEHELINKSEFGRTVLIIDYYKPLPFFYHILNKIEIRRIARSEYVKGVIRKLNK